jgi:hypothetical protein
MISNTIVEYYDFLERKDEIYRGNYEILDDGSEALYCILFKLMGDERSFDTLCEDFLDWPTATELKGTAQDGNYTSLVSMMRDHDCGMLKNGAVMEITSQIIQDLEMCIPSLIDRIAGNDSAKNVEFLEHVWKKFYE